MKISAYLKYDPDEKSRPGHQQNYESLSKYFKRHCIPFNHLEKDNPLMSSCIKTGINDQLYNILRINQFLESSDDYGIFIDLNTSIINIHNDLHASIDYDLQIFSEASPNNIDKDSYLTIDKPYKEKVYFQKMINGDNGSGFICNTGFMGLSKYFCEDFMKFLEKNNFDISKNNDVKNLLAISQYENLTDAILFECFLGVHDSRSKYEVKSLYEERINPIILDNTLGTDDITLEQLMYWYPIFFRHGEVTKHTKYFVKNGLLENIGLQEYNNIRHLRYAEMFYKFHTK